MKRVKLLMSIMLLAFAFGFSSCDDDPSYYYDVVGTWELAYDEYGAVNTIDVDKYAFYSDGKGVYGYYDRDGYWVSDALFVWGYRGNNMIYIDFGAGEVYYYYFDFNGSHLVLSEDPSFRTFLEYRPVRY